MEHNNNCYYPKPYFNDCEFYEVLEPFVIPPDMLMIHGYPIEILHHPGSAMLYKTSFETVESVRKLNFYERSGVRLSTNYQNKDDIKLVYNDDFDPKIILPSTLSTLSQNVSIHDDYKCLEFECEFTEKDAVNMVFRFVEDIRNSINNNIEVSEQLKCVRCKRGFFVSKNGEYLTKEKCFYHPGKLFGEKFNCCLGDSASKGCTQNDVHVWNGTEPGFNPMKGFVKTQPRPPHRQLESERVYALDTEMCYTSNGLDATKISIVSIDGRIIYHYMIQPATKIVDYNTKFSGITANDFAKVSQVKTLQEVQEDLLSFIFTDTILIGHGLENDLRALKIIHYKVIDTTLLFPNPRGFPYRTSLKRLAKVCLQRIIHDSAYGHNCLEDARATMDLVLYKLGLRPISDPKYSLPWFYSHNNLNLLGVKHVFHYG